jgi:hypothetical protein
MVLEGKECLVERSLDKERSIFRKSELESFFVRKINICLVEEERIRSSMFQKRKICLKVRPLQVLNKEDLFKNIGSVHVPKRKICLLERRYYDLSMSHKKTNRNEWLSWVGG